MAITREIDLDFLIKSHRNVVRTMPESIIKGFFERCHEALLIVGCHNKKYKASTFDICKHIPKALAVGMADGPELKDLANAFERIAPKLNWQRRENIKYKDQNFPSGHANAVLVGDNGLEQHQCVRLGVSLLAPNIEYPDHNHPPEEGYLVISEGYWRQEKGNWVERKPGQTIHNTPNITHSMKSKDTPLLALWMLWTGP